MESDCTHHNCVFKVRALFVEEVGQGKWRKELKTQPKSRSVTLDIPQCKNKTPLSLDSVAQLRVLLITSLI